MIKNYVEVFRCAIPFFERFYTGDKKKCVSWATCIIIKMKSKFRKVKLQVAKDDCDKSYYTESLFYRTT